MNPPRLTCSQRQWLHSSVDRASHWYCEVTGSNPIEVLNFFFVGVFTQLHKLRSLRQSFLHLHFFSAVHISFISFIINTHFFHGKIWTHNWPAPNVSGFIAQLVEHRTSKSRGHGFKRRWSPDFFFQASLHNCINCVHCNDHFFIFISFPQFIYDFYMISTWFLLDRVPTSKSCVFCLGIKFLFFTISPFHGRFLLQGLFSWKVLRFSLVALQTWYVKVWSVLKE